MARLIQSKTVGVDAVLLASSETIIRHVVFF
jgi:hypothetical protein